MWESFGPQTQKEKETLTLPKWEKWRFKGAER